MDGSNRQVASLPGPNQDTTAQSEREEARSASAVKSTRNPNLSIGRDRGYSLGRVSFSESVNNQSDHVGIELVEAQPSKANVAYDAKEGMTPDSKRMEALSTIAFPNFNSWVRWHKEMIMKKASLWCKEYIFRGILRQREIPSTKDGRHIDLDVSRDIPLIDERTGKEYISNTIRSSRYTIWSFLPCQLWFQFSKVANFFFLVTGAVQLIPGLSTTGSFATILPLLFFLSFSIAREGYDDFRRYQLDKVENRRLVRTLYGYRPGGVEGQIRRSFAEIAQKSWNSVKSKVRKGGDKDVIEARPVTPESNKYSETTPPAESDNSGPSPWATIKWIDLKVGDIIELKRDDQVPADIVLLYADGRNGIAYIETMALDGETNLKSKQPPRLLAERCGTLADISSCRAHFVVEDPNLDLYEFNGKVSVDGKTLPLTLNNVVYRGSTLRNTIRAVGMVINTGEECKIRMNASRNPQTKAPAIQAMTNRVVILLMVFVILLSIGCTAGYEIWTGVFEDNAWYLAESHLPLDDIFIGFAIEFNNLIPLALYVSLEIIKFAQILLLRDVEMYDPVSDTPMVSNTQTIIENLGQVNYIFTDKTGTLTENVMRFQKMSVAGTAWLHNIDVHKEVARRDAKDNEDRTTTKEKAHQTGRQGEGSVPTAATSSPLTNDDLPCAPQRAQSASLQMESTATSADSQWELCTDELLRYLQYNPSTAFAQKARFFLLSLAICHTCFPEVQKNGEISFQAASPDELALVEAAQDLGYIVIDRTTQSITLLTYPSGSDLAVRETYEVLDVIEFSSKRKRMSIIVRFPNGKICIFCKGADSVIQPRFKLASLAMRKASQVERRRRQRMGEEAEEALLRKSEEQDSINSFHTSSLSLNRLGMNRRSTTFRRTSISSIELDPINDEMSSRLHGHENDVHRDAQGTLRISMGSDRRRSLAPSKPRTSMQNDYHHGLIDEAQLLDDATVFERCLTHINDFASEGLRTLVYGYRFIDDEEYTTWSKIYHHAATSLVRRQEMIESAGEMIEQNFDLAGVTAIEDKLQKGVPETIDKLQRANIKIWMLTGDKRETAINIAHSTRICKSYSQVIILDHENCEIEQQMASSLLEVTKGRIAHSVVVIDGQTLVGIESKETLATQFYELLLRVDSVICCRASPCQKAAMVKKIRHKVPGSITLAIGDGGNDVAMIQEAHVGVGISGKEGLQAARVADYSIAQFRFLQRLLFVHGHWNYIRTAKYILLTFWKEMLFYSVQAMYQRWNGYTGTSLYESDSLVVWNTLFTSLPVMLPGIFEQDLSAATLLAVPELYGYGQESRGFNMKKYSLWMIMAACESQIIYFMVYGLYGIIPITNDQGMFAIGDLAFSVCVVFINVKLL